MIKDEPVYEKPEIKINEEYFRRAGIPLEGEEKGKTPVQGSPSRVIGRKQTIAEALAEVRGEKFSRETEKPSMEEEKFSQEQELTKEEDAAIDAEMEAILKESLDAEYFQWIGEEDSSEKQEKKGLARFLKNT